MIHLDTHVLVWLLTDERTRLPAGVRQLLESQQLLVSAAAALSWTRDPLDRLIAGTSLVDRCDLLTADETMLRHLPSARWPD